jgi:hypothetical protein
MKCLKCQKELIGKQTKYCSRKCQNDIKNPNLQSYKCQQVRALERKKELINTMGGSCSKCGYHKSIAALEFHHLNPTEKEFNLDARSLSNRKWERVIAEAKKCILLCANCHRELHHPN